MDTLLESLYVVYDVCIQPRPIQMLTNILLDFCGREVALVMLLQKIFTEAGWNYYARAHQQQAFICRKLVFEVPVCPGHPWSMPPLMWPSLLSELAHHA